MWAMARASACMSRSPLEVEVEADAAAAAAVGLLSCSPLEWGPSQEEGRCFLQRKVSTSGGVMRMSAQ